MEDRLGWVVDDLRRVGDGLQQTIDATAAQSYEAGTPDGVVRVRVNGRCRLTSLDLDPSLLRQDPGTLDALLTTTLNVALAQARAGTREALMDALPPSLRSGIDQTEAGR